MTYTQPLLFCCLLFALVGLLKTRRSKGKYVTLAGLIAIFLISWPPLDWFFGLPLESEYPVRPFKALPDIQAIVVLGSAVEPAQYEKPYPVPDPDTFKRCEHAAWIYRQMGARPVLACEGLQSKGKASAMRELLRRAGVPDNLMWVETDSRSTHENAVYGARILRDHGIKRIALVVEAQSMKRAAACFRKEGIDVTPAPSEFRTLGPLIDELLPSWKAIRRNEITLHELLGLAWYRLRGWI
jgi:uncharacterized SAM-binding protein YcdF (DUF218 family)